MQKYMGRQEDSVPHGPILVTVNGRENYDGSGPSAANDWYDVHGDGNEPDCYLDDDCLF